MATHATPTGKTAQTTPTLTDAFLYTLAKQLPNLADRGCTIGTDYGDITVPPGRMAERLAAWLQREVKKGALQ